MKKEIPSLPGYFASDDGRIYFGEVELKYRKCSHRPYLKVTIIGDGERLVHRLILETFVSECPNGMQACHNNGNGQDNRLVNLRWDTPRKNSNDRRLHGTSGLGDRNPMAKLTSDQVSLIKLCMKDMTNSDISKYFNVSIQCISDIRKNRSWSHIKAGSL